MNKLLIFLLAMFVGLPAFSQTMSDAFQQAWLRTPQASAMSLRELEANARAEAAAGIIPGAPSMSVSNLNDKLDKNRGRQEWEVEMSVSLWLPAQQSARKAEASTAQIEFTARQLALRLQIAGELRETWWAVAMARNGQQLAQERLATARTLETDVQRRYKVGELARIDSNLAQSERLAAEQDMADADMSLRKAEQTYRHLTGGLAPALLPTEIGSKFQDILPEQHPQVLAAMAAVDLARAKLKLADESRRDAPALAVRVLRERAYFSETYANAIGFKLTIPFSSGPKVRLENAAARAELSQADTELLLSKTKVELEITKARLDLDNTTRQLDLSKQRRELAADNMRLAEKSFALGESDLPSLLRIRAATYEAEAMLHRQQVLLAAAQSKLNQSLGVLP